MIYRKQGSVARWENGTLIRVLESGAAREEGEVFECWPDESSRLPVAESSRALAVVRALQHLPIERLIVIDGVAEHEYDGRRWRDETDRLHLSMVHGHLRVIVDSTTRRLDDIEPIANALQRATTERDAPKHLRLAPNVSAALIPHLPNAIQSAGGKDGYGEDILESTASFYRPSYRVRPIRTPLNVHLESFGTIDEDLPRAIALLAPVEGSTLRVLIEDKQRVYPATVEVKNVRAASDQRTWYPYAAGSFGAELML